jgi:hypothetical protein
LVVEAPGAIAGTFQLWIVGTTSDGVVWYTSRAGVDPSGAWNGWNAVHPETAMVSGAEVAAIWRPVGPQTTPRLDLFSRCTGGSVWSIWYEPTYWS